MSDNLLHQRGIIEALRTGVPTRDAVTLLGSGQSILDERFRILLDSTRFGMPQEVRGFVYFGGFGTGKSHVLEAFATRAINENFVVSRVTISQNLKLGTLSNVLSELLNNTETQQHHEDGFARLIADAIETKTDFLPLIRWTELEITDNRLAPIFGVIANSLRSLRYGSDEFETVLNYLRGMSVFGRLKSLLEARNMQSVPAAIQRPQCIKFISQLFKTMGYSGWVVLIDELELIRLTPGKIQKGKSYAELANWMGLDGMRPAEGLAVVGCMTSGYVNELIRWSATGANELDEIPFAMENSVSGSHLVSQATSGMNLLEECDSDTDLTLKMPNDAALLRVQNIVKSSYEQCYRATVNPITVESGGIEPMRIHIRRWILQWDLQRLMRSEMLVNKPVIQNLSPIESDEIDDAFDDD
jgi:hypothetical protein